MRFAPLLGLFGIVIAADDPTASTTASTTVQAAGEQQDFVAAINSVQERAFWLPAPIGPPVSTCPYNNCHSCVDAGCAWVGGVCRPCFGCPWSQRQCSGCVSDFQCGPNMRCDNGQCLSNPGDFSCDFVHDCYSCLRRPNCLWDPNTLGGSCKPKEQCDFTYFRTMSLTAGARPASACVASLDRCSQTNFDGAPLTPNPEVGVGCTTHGQCQPGEYCYSCSKCRTNCGRCNLPGATPVSGMCSPAWRCPIDNDSISGTCPSTNPWPNPWPWPTYPVVSTSCPYSTCFSCTAAPGCVWSGSTCYYSTTGCVGAGCANYPSQCSSVFTPGSSCSSYLDCRSCAAAYGCVWSGTICYYTTVPCSGFGCANTPAACPSYGGVGCFSDWQCGAGQRCSGGMCVGGGFPPYGGSCNSYYDCPNCLGNPNCLWDPNSLSNKCKPKEQCDFTYRSLTFAPALSFAPTATACVRTLDRCWGPTYNGEILNPNPSRGFGCTTHDQCAFGEYCFSCSLCRGDCSVCGGFPPVSGGCGPRYRCAIDRDSINGVCP